MGITVGSGLVPQEEEARPLVRLVARDELCNRRNVVPWLGNGRSGRSSLTVQELTEPNLSKPATASIRASLRGTCRLGARGVEMAVSKFSDSR
jgi:hypothetical protein